MKHPCRRERAFSWLDVVRMTFSMIIDAMSKWKTSVPYFAREPKCLDGKGTQL